MVRRAYELWRDTEHESDMMAKYETCAVVVEL